MTSIAVKNKIIPTAPSHHNPTKTDTYPNALAEAVGNLLRAKKQTLAVAESCSGGLLSDILTDVPGSSDYFLGAVVAYSNKIKTMALGVDSLILKKYGAVSAPVVKAMTKGICERFESDYGVSISGIAGPLGGTPKKPVGLVYIGISAKNWLWAKKFVFKGDRKSIKRQSAEKALDCLRKKLSESPAVQKPKTKSY